METGTDQEQVIVPPAPKKERIKRPRQSKAKGLGLHQMWHKKYKTLENLPPEIVRAFGELTPELRVLIKGASFQGKSRFTMWFLKVLLNYGKLAYLALEEEHRRSMQKNIKDNLTLDEHNGKIIFWNAGMTHEETMMYLGKKKSPQFVVVDSLQYWNISPKQYRELIETYRNKGFIFISQAEGGNAKGALAKSVEFDADIKITVKQFVAEIKVRGEGIKYHVIWEEGAIKFYGKKKVNQFKK